MIKVISAPVKWVSKLDDSDEIVSYIIQHSSSDVDYDWARENLEESYGKRCYAVLKRITVSKLKHGNADTNQRNATLQKRYNALPVDTQPPLLVDPDLEVLDGNHRLRSARKQKVPELWCYQIVERD